VGTRPSRKLRAAGRIPGNLQAEDDAPNLDLSIDEEAFMTARRQHEHVYELEIGSAREAALVREVVWDVFGERILHVEFRRVDLTQKTEVEVALTFTGHPKGVLNQLSSQITISALPQDIPDGIEVSVADMEVGHMILGKDLAMPEGVSLAEDPELKIAVIVEAEEVEEAKPEAAEEESAAGTVPEAGTAEKAEDDDSKSDKDD